MRHLSVILISVFSMIFLFAGIATSPQTGGDISVTKTKPVDAIRYFRVYFDNLDMAHKIVISMNTVESKYEKGFVIVEIAGPEEFQRLKETGLKMEQIPDPLAEKVERIRREAPYTTEGIPGYSCYRTVEETFAAAQTMVSTYPGLVTWTDIGDSWEKSAALGGYDIFVLKLTNSAITGDKPKLFLSGSIHAREYTPAELLTRLAEHMLSHYGTDADITWLIDHHEVHMVLQGNPDGRKKAETGLSWRKNTNQNYCSPTSNYRGADLNRNFSFKWNCCGGSSTYECDSTYNGAFAASEPEVDAIETYIRSHIADQRGPNNTDAAPQTATGIYLDIHSHGELILWPWGWTSAQAPNHTGLQTFSRKMAYFNNHHPKQGWGLYPTDGTAKLFGYGELGLVSCTVELGTSFFQDCSYFENTILPDNIAALIYVAKVARTPYMTPAGPDVVNPSLSSGSTLPGISPGTACQLTATVNDTRYSNVNGTEPSQAINAAEYYIDTPPWVASPTPVAVAMTASDGTFDNSLESVQASVDTSGLSDGKHMLFIRGRDANGNWGAFSAVFLYISSASGDLDPPTPNPAYFSTVPIATGQTSISMTAYPVYDPSGLEYYFECGTPGGHDSGWQNSRLYRDTGLVPGTMYSYRIKARDKSVNQNETGYSAWFSATTDSPPTTWIQLVYDDFETGFGNYTDGGGDCLLYTNGYHAHQGTNAIDIQNNSGIDSSFYLTNGIDVDTPGYTEIKIEFWFKAISMESGEDFRVEYYDGSTWQTVATYARGTDFNNDAFYNKSISITESSYTFPTGMKIRFTCDAGDSRDDVYIDEVKISAR